MEFFHPSVYLVSIDGFGHIGRQNIVHALYVNSFNEDYRISFTSVGSFMSVDVYLFVFVCVRACALLLVLLIGCSSPALFGMCLIKDENENAHTYLTSSNALLA